MGSPVNEAWRWEDETQHPAEITRPFLMQATEVTQAQWSQMRWEGAVVTNPSNFYAGEGAGTRPVERVNWYEALAYCNWLSTSAGLPECYELANCTNTPGKDMECSTAGLRAGQGWTSVVECPGYRLPTEAEWEYAARATTTAATYAGDLDAGHLLCEQPNPALDGIAWFCGNAQGWPHPVGEKDPNSWGLHDMLGNIWEWCGDWYGDYPAAPPADYVGPPEGSNRVLRGGAWGYLAQYVRAAYRRSYGPGERSVYFGFRPLRSLP